MTPNQKYKPKLFSTILPFQPIPKTEVSKLVQEYCISVTLCCPSMMICKSWCLSDQYANLHVRMSLATSFFDTIFEPRTSACRQNWRWQNLGLAWSCRFCKMDDVCSVEAWVEQLQYSWGCGTTSINRIQSCTTCCLNFLNTTSVTQTISWWLTRANTTTSYDIIFYHYESVSYWKEDIHTSDIADINTHLTSDRINCVARPTNHFTAKTWSWNMQIWTELDQRSSQFLVYTDISYIHIYIYARLEISV